jgi:Flp pilus assembly secretin CpaC
MVVIAPGRIWLKVSTEVSALTQNSVVVPFGDDSFRSLAATRPCEQHVELPAAAAS